MMFRRKVLAAIAAAAIACAVAGCGGSSDTGASGDGGTKGPTTLTLGGVLPPATYAAQDAAWGNESIFYQAVFDGLLKADPTGKILPSLATEWKYNDSKTMLDMTLRNDVTFSDGTKFTADAAVQNLIRFRDGASGFKNNLAGLKEAKAVDDTHLTLTLSASDPAFLIYLTQPAGLVESPAAFAKPDIKTNPIGSGPYILDTTKTVVGSSYVYTKNPNYWDKASQHYDNLVISVLSDPTAMLNAIKGGQVNGAKLASNDVIPQVKAAGYDAVTWEGDWTGLLLFDRAGTMNPALKDIRVRQAINYAFDTKGLLAAIAKGGGTPTTQIFRADLNAYDPALDSRYSYDPAKAKSLLAEAGYPNGFTLAMPGISALGATFTLIAQQLKDIGITVDYTDITPSSFLGDILAPKFPASWISLNQDTDWQVINLAITPAAAWNPFKYEDPEVDALVETVRSAASGAEADAAARELNAYIVEQAWFAPWYRLQSNYATDSKTVTVAQVGNAYPYLWNFVPKS